MFRIMSSVSEINNAKIDVNAQISKITEERINELENLWSTMYDAQIVKQNIHKLTEHVHTFYNEIFQEISTRKDRILKTISEHRNEINKLESLLCLDESVDYQNDTEGPKRIYEYQIYLTDKLANYKNKISDLQDKIKLLNSNENSICNQLAIAPICLPIDPLPCKKDIQTFESRLQDLEILRSSRRIKYINLMKQIKNLAAETKFDLDEDNSFKIIKLSETSGYLSDDNIKGLNDVQNNLIEYKSKLEENILIKKEQLSSLFDCLEVSPKLRTSFLELNEYSQCNLDILHEEVKRCEQIKHQNIKKIVEKTREQIIEFWDKTMKSDEERSQFIPITSTLYNAELLTLHETELKNLKIFYAENLLIYQKLNEYKTLWESFRALEAKEKEPGRYQNRGGQLLLEEKERRTIKLKFPKIMAVIKKLVTDYENQKNYKFLVYGRNIIDVINEDNDNHMTTKEQQMSARKATRKDLTSQSNLSTPRSIRTCSPIPGSSQQQNIRSTIKKITSNTNINKPSISSHSKRNVLSNIKNVPNIKITPASPIKTKKSKAKKKRVISTLANSRRSSSGQPNSSFRQQNSSSQKRSSLIKKETSVIIISDTSSSSSSSSSPSPLQSDSLINYNVFEDQINTRVKSRSSAVFGAETIQIVTSEQVTEK